jgi:enoyl-[acyl-carrier-protein] reductase (NADH)
MPARRTASAEDVIGAAILLASPAGVYITGQVQVIDGGGSVAFLGV